MPFRRQRPQVIRVLEHSRVHLPARYDTPRTRERLEDAARRAGKRAFEIRGHGLYTRDIVGVVDIGSVAVELLPKTSDLGTVDQGRVFLINLLRFASHGRALAVSDARIAIGDRSFLEIVLAWAVQTATVNIRNGLPRRYMLREEVSAAVRGRVNLRRVALARPEKPFELLVRHAPLIADNPITRIVKWMIGKIFYLTRVGGTRLRCQAILRDLENVSEIRPAELDFAGIVLQALEADWAPLLSFAQSLLQQLLPNPTGAGEVHSVAVLFTLHDLFEAALRKVFREGLPSHGISLRRLDGTLLRPIPADHRSPIIRLKPDFSFLQSEQPEKRGLGDAKWKRFLTAESDIRPSEEDAYQLTAYLTALQGSSGFLFCPLYGVPASSQVRLSSWQLSGGGQPVHFVAIDVAALVMPDTRGKALRAALCKTVAAKFLAEQTALQNGGA
jgi:5-methylcytosine-specific restriction enzyme subunit McrC